jgi:CRISPR system Cascade subunit CasA
MTFRSKIAAMGAASALAACAHYDARPVAPDRFAATYDSVRLEPHAGPWSDADLLTAALTHSPAIHQAEAAYRTARAAARAARTPPNISLTLVGEYSRDSGGTSDWLASGLLDIPLDVGGRRSARLQGADLATVQALYDYAEAVWAVRSALVHAHIERLAADRQLALAREAVRIRADRAHQLENRIQSGEDARPAGLTAQGDLAAAERRLQEAGVRKAAAEGALAKALGVPVAAVQDIALEPLPDTVTAPHSMQLTAWRQDAAAHRRDVLRAVADYDAAEQALRLEVAKQYPDIHVGPGYTFDHGAHKIPFNLVLVLPPQDLNKANIQAAEARRLDASARLDAAQAAVLSGVDQAAAALNGAQGGLIRADQQELPLIRRAAVAARRGLDAGELDRTDQEAAEAAVIDAQLSRLDSWRLAWTAAADLEDALRRPSPGEAAVLDAAVKRAGDAP